MWWTFGSMAALAAALGGGAAWAIISSKDQGHPDYWKLALLGLLAVLGVWAVRLVVRMFLSDQHLATDAAERVTMVQTYLSLIEGGKLTSDDDRKLILQALFRPASDGIVKDENPPHLGLDILTRPSSR